MKQAQIRNQISRLKQLALTIDPNAQSQLNTEINLLQKNINANTRICKYWRETGMCPYGYKCYFRHEIIPKSIRCKFGQRCKYYQNNKCEYTHYNYQLNTFIHCSNTNESYQERPSYCNDHTKNQAVQEPDSLIVTTTGTTEANNSMDNNNQVLKNNSRKQRQEQRRQQKQQHQQQQQQQQHQKKHDFKLFSINETEEEDSDDSYYYNDISDNSDDDDIIPSSPDDSKLVPSSPDVSKLVSSSPDGSKPVSSLHNSKNRSEYTYPIQILEHFKFIRKILKEREMSKEEMKHYLQWTIFLSIRQEVKKDSPLTKIITNDMSVGDVFLFVYFYIQCSTDTPNVQEKWIQHQDTIKEKASLENIISQ